MKKKLICNPNIIMNGLWKKNSTLVQFLGLCPVLAVTSTVINALSLGITTTMVLMITNVSISCVRTYIPKSIRIPIYMMIISSIVSSVELLLHAYFSKIYDSLGIFIPLIVTNCIIVGRAEMIAIKNSLLTSLLDGFFIGTGSTVSMLILGSFREIIGRGTLFSGIDQLLSDAYFNFSDINIINIDYVLLIGALPSGSFIILAFIVAIKSWIDNRRIIYKKNSIKNSDNIEIRTFFE